MDFSRRPYATKCKFNRNSDVESTVVWYVAAKDAPTLPYPSAINVMAWDKEPWQPQPVGEVWQAPTPYNGMWTPPPGADGLHQCGTEEDFRTGGLRDETLPPVKYTTTGLPVCCNPAIPGRGGAGAGGKSPVSYTPPTPVPGPTCATAAPVFPATTYNYTIAGTGTHQWWSVSGLSPATTYHVDYGGTVPGFMAIDMWAGSSCALLRHIGSPVTGTCLQFTLLPGENMYLHFRIVIPGTYPYDWILLTGPC